MNRPLPVIDCRRCGVCCRHMAYPAFNLPTAELLGESEVQSTAPGSVASRDRERWERLPPALRESVREAMRAYRPPEGGALDGACLWLDLETGRCCHHDHRPQVCRDFEVGSAACLEWRSAYGVSDSPA